MTSIYIITNADHEQRSEYKLGIHSGSVTKLMSRYKTYQIDRLKFFHETSNSSYIEDKIKQEYINDRINNSEWFRIDPNILIKRIIELDDELAVTKQIGDISLTNTIAINPYLTFEERHPDFYGLYNDFKNSKMYKIDANDNLIELYYSLYTKFIKDLKDKVFNAYNNACSEVRVDITDKKPNDDESDININLIFKNGHEYRYLFNCRQLILDNTVNGYLNYHDTVKELHTRKYRKFVTKLDIIDDVIAAPHNKLIKIKDLYNTKVTRAYCIHRYKITDIGILESILFADFDNILYEIIYIVDSDINLNFKGNDDKEYINEASEDLLTRKFEYYIEEYLNQVCDYHFMCTYVINKEYECYPIGDKFINLNKNTIVSNNLICLFLPRVIMSDNKNKKYIMYGNGYPINRSYEDIKLNSITLDKYDIKYSEFDLKNHHKLYNRGGFGNRDDLIRYYKKFNELKSTLQGYENIGEQLSPLFYKIREVLKV